MNKFLFVIIVPSDFWQALEEKLFENDYKCEDYGRDSGYCKHCSESAFNKSHDEEMSETSSKEYPV